MTTISSIGEGFLILWGDTSFEGLIEGRVWVAINFFIIFSALVAVGLIVAAGYMFITASGDPEKIEKAQKALTAAIVGMIIVFMSRLIVGFVIDVGKDEVEPARQEEQDFPDIPPDVPQPI